MELNKRVHSIEIPKQKPAVLIIYEQLLSAIVHGKLEEGERLLEANLAKLFGVSRQPIREALRMLETDGFIELVPYKGVTVSRITPQEARESQELKGMVEGYTAWKGAQIFGPDKIAELEAVLLQTESHIQKSQWRKIIQDNYSFHCGIVNGVGNEKMLRYYQGLFNSHQRYYAIGLLGQPSSQTSLVEHQLILEKIKSRDAEGAFACAHQHTVSTLARVLEALEKRKKETGGSLPTGGRSANHG